jgi:type IV pilus assembly protein PilX
MHSSKRPALARRPALVRERGAALLVTLIVMALMALGALSFARSTDTANLIAGNAAFKQAATQAAEVGLDAAARYVDALADGNLAVPGRYFPMPQFAEEPPVDYDWKGVPALQVGNFKVQHIIERMCSAKVVVDPVSECAGRTSPAQGSQKAGAPVLQGQPVIYYRATARVTGPRNAESLVQAAFSR